MANFGALNNKMTLKFGNWLWFPIYCTPYEYSARWHLTAFPVTFSIPRDQLTLLWTVLFSSICGVVRVLLGARQLCYLFFVFVVRSEINLSLILCIRRDRNAPCVNSVNNFCFIYGEITNPFTFNLSDTVSLLQYCNIGN